MHFMKVYCWYRLCGLSHTFLAHIKCLTFNFLFSLKEYHLISAQANSVSIPVFCNLMSDAILTTAVCYKVKHNYKITIRICLYSNTVKIHRTLKAFIINQTNFYFSSHKYIKFKLMRFFKFFVGYLYQAIHYLIL